MKKTLYIVRGLPGSGKGEKAKELAGEAVCSAMDFVDPKEGFSYENLPMYHQCCEAHVRWMLSEGIEKVAVHNAFTRIDYIKPYLELANRFGYEVSVLTCKPFKATHVPLQVINNMQKKFEKIA